MEEIIYPKYRWFVLIALCIVQIAANIAIIYPVTMIGEISKSMAVDMGVATQITLVVIQISIGISAFLGGRIIDRFGAYRVWVACSILLIIGSSLIPIIGNSVWGILLVRIIQGFGAGPMMATAALVAAQWFPIKERAHIIGVQGAGVPVGIILSMTFVPLFFQKTGSWQAALMWMSMFFVVTLISSLLVVMGPKPPAGGVGVIDDHPKASESDIKKAYRLPATWAGIACILWFMCACGPFNNLITNYLAVDQPMGLGMGPMKAGSIMSGANICFTLAGLLSGLILEKIFKGRLRPLVMTGFVLSMILWPSVKLPTISSNTVMITAFMCAGAFGIGMTIVLVMTFFAKNYPLGIMGKIGGMIVVANIAGNMASTGLASYGLSMTGSYNTAFGIIAAASLFGFLTAILLKEPTVFLKEKRQG